MFNASLHRIARVVVDPNVAVRTDPSLSAAFFDDATFVPAPGDFVHAVQPEPDVPGLIGAAEVVRVDQANRVIFLRVDWHSFIQEYAFAPNSTAKANLRASAVANAHATVSAANGQRGRASVSFG